MKNHFPFFRLVFGMLIGVLFMAACSPKFDWREVRGSNAPFTAAFPSKTVSHTRSFNLAGAPITMTMTAAQVDGVTFAIGSAEMPDAMQAKAALTQMKIGLVKNIDGVIRREKNADGANTSIEIEATGTQNQYGNVKPMLLIARFVAHDKRVYQIFVVGKEKAVVREAVDNFLISFKLNR